MRNGCRCRCRLRLELAIIARTWNPAQSSLLGFKHLHELKVKQLWPSLNSRFNSFALVSAYVRCDLWIRPNKRLSFSSLWSKVIKKHLETLYLMQYGTCCIMALQPKICLWTFLFSLIDTSISNSFSNN